MQISHVLLFLTYRCNLRCSFCLSFNNYWQPEPILNIPIAKVKKEMTTNDIIKRVIPQCVKNNIEVIALSGGEILLRKDIITIFRELGKANIRWCFDSNLMLCTKSIAKEAIAASCDAVFVSIDGTKEIHNKLRCNPKAYDNCIDGLKNLIEAKNEVINSNTQIIINCVLQPENEHVPPDIVKLANKYNIKDVSFQLLSERNFNKAFLSGKAYQSIEQAKQIAKGYGINISNYPLPNPKENNLNSWFSEMKPNVFFNGCDYINYNLRIDPQGNVIPCIEYNMGNILEKNLSDIWQSESYTLFRNHVINSKGFDSCSRCCNMKVK
jgi:MoaA/NifB/PqqE/SkfB family radical SAM enzyme